MHKKQFYMAPEAEPLVVQIEGVICESGDRSVSHSFPRVFFKLARLMKKHVFSLGLMLVAALAFTNCAKQEVINDTPEQPAGVPFELTAGMDTKTEATDAGVITWKTGDALAVFHAEAGSTTYSKNDKFTFDSGSSFKGELQDGALTADAYDWYALYPYYYSIPAPDNITTGYTTFAASQTQTGNNSMAHLCGSNVPMYGKATGVAKDTKPTITMNQAASIIKVHVTNSLDADLTVTSVSFTAQQDIVGNFFINFAGAQPSFTKTGTPKTTATLTVKEGNPIAKAGTADFYIVVKPFEAAANDEITVSVNGLEKTIKLASAVTFAPGKIKTVNFNFDQSVFMWDLTTNSYSSASANQVTWNHIKAQMVADKASATTDANNYLGGDANNRTSSRFYKNSILTITPSTGVLISKVEAEATSESYANALKNSVWTNATAEVDGTKITITPTNGESAFFATLGGTVGLSGVTVFYTDLVVKNVVSIAVTTPPTKTDYKVGETLDMSGAVITATYDDATTDDVTAYVTTDAAEVLNHAGDAKLVTVTFEGKTATFNVNVAKGDADLSYSIPSYSVLVGADFATPVLTNPHGLTVTYSSSDEDLVLVDENKGDVVIGSNAGGPVTITASTTGNADYNAGSASYTITITDSVDYSTVYTSNVTLSTTGGASASSAKVVIDDVQYDAIKAGTGSKTGAMKLTVPSGATKLHVHMAGWSGETVQITVSPLPNIDSTNPVSLTADSGVSGSSTTYTLSGSASSYYFAIDLKSITTDTELTFSATSGKRFVIWGVNAE